MMHRKQKDLLFQDGPEEKNSEEAWKVLIVDDEKSVHDMTTLVLADFKYAEKPLHFLHAYSNDEAKQVLKENSDIAVMLLDVIMEEPDSGLKFVKYLRDVVKNKITRVILRTGQPGMVPDRQVTAEYEINDYREKSELTSTKLYTALTTAIRAYCELKQAETEKINIALQAKESIQEAETNLKLITDALPALISYIDNSGRIKFNNKAHEFWLGITSDMINGKSMYDIWNLVGNDSFDHHWQKALQNIPTSFDFKLNHKKLGVRDVNIIFIPHHSQGQLSGCFCLINDITDRKHTEENLNYLATHDNLTNTVNKRFFDVCITHSINKAQQYNNLFALLFVDLDGFKTINDNFGHDIGDLVLTHTAERIHNCVRKFDTVARFGGDEFIIILEEIPSEIVAANVAQKICELLAQPFNIDGKQCTITASIGISIYPFHGTDKETLLKRADLAMYQIKNDQQNNYAFYNEDDHRDLLRESHFIKEMLHGLENNEFVMYYQPIIDATIKEIIALEALIRWKHPQHNLLLPEQFLPLAEKANLILPIGEWMLRQACKDAAILHKLGKKITVHVNISTQQLLKGRIIELIKKILQETGLENKYLAIELSESLTIKDLDIAIKIMGELKALGITLILDDFGSGYSSLNYLSRLPIDAIKLDQNVVKNLPANLNNITIVSAISRLMRELSLDIVMEGSDNEQQMVIISKADNEQLRGYLIGKALVFAEIKQLLTA